MKRKNVFLVLTGTLIICMTACGNESNHSPSEDAKEGVVDFVQNQMNICHNGIGFGTDDFSATYTDSISGLYNEEVEITSTKLNIETNVIEIEGNVVVAGENKTVIGEYELDSKEIIFAEAYFAPSNNETEETESEIEETDTERIDVAIEEKVEDKPKDEETKEETTKEEIKKEEKPKEEKPKEEKPKEEKPKEETPPEQLPDDNEDDETYGWLGPGFQSGVIEPDEPKYVTIHDDALGGEVICYVPELLLETFCGRPIKWAYWETDVMSWEAGDTYEKGDTIFYQFFAKPDGTLIKKRTYRKDPNGNGLYYYEEYF